MLNNRKYGEIYQTPHGTLIENGTDLDRYKEIYKDKDNYQIHIKWCGKSW